MPPGPIIVTAGCLPPRLSVAGVPLPAVARRAGWRAWADVRRVALAGALLPAQGWVGYGSRFRSPLRRQRGRRPRHADKETLLFGGDFQDFGEPFGHLQGGATLAAFSRKKRMVWTEQ